MVLDTLTGETKALKVPYDLGPLVFDLEAIEGFWRRRAPRAWWFFQSRLNL